MERHFLSTKLAISCLKSSKIAFSLSQRGTLPYRVASNSKNSSTLVIIKTVNILSHRMVTQKMTNAQFVSFPKKDKRKLKPYSTSEILTVICTCQVRSNLSYTSSKKYLSWRSSAFINADAIWFQVTSKNQRKIAKTCMTFSLAKSWTRRMWNP